MSLIDVFPEQQADAADIERLLDDAFGADRLAKISYSYRRGVERLWPLCLTLRRPSGLVGTIRAWPIAIGSAPTPAILIGPVAIDAALRDHGFGGRLIGEVVSRARGAGYAIGVLVGDAAYYGRFGFVPAATWHLTMPRENPARVLGLRLDETVPVEPGDLMPFRSGRANPRDRSAMG
jgi:predicted N-acetyltransferase YhbS